MSNNAEQRLEYWPLTGRVFLFLAIVTGTVGLALPTAALMFASWYLKKVPVDKQYLTVDLSDQSLYRHWIPVWLITLIPWLLIFLALTAMVFNASYIILRHILEIWPFHNGLFLFNTHPWNVSYSPRIGPFWWHWRYDFGPALHTFPKDGFVFAAAVIPIGVLGALFAQNWACVVMIRELTTRIHLPNTRTNTRIAATKSQSRFSGSYWSLLGISVLLVALMIITLGIAMPYIIYRYRRYIAAHIQIDGVGLRADKHKWHHMKRWLLIWLLWVAVHVIPFISVLWFFVTTFVFCYAGKWFMEGLQFAKKRSRSSAKKI